MWPLWGLDLSRVRCDLHFTEAINQRMQVPSRLKVAESCSPGDRKPVAEDVPASFRMHIPERISLAEISDTSLRPVLLTQPRTVPSVVVQVSPGPSGDLPLLPSASRAGAQRRKRAGHHSSRSRRDRTPSDSAQLALHSPGQHQEGGRQDLLHAEHLPDHVPAGPGALPPCPGLSARPGAVQLPGAHPSRRERLGGGRGAGGGSHETAAGQDLGEAAPAGGAVPRLETEGGPAVLRDDLCLPHQHVALAQKMTACAQPPLLPLAGWLRAGTGAFLVDLPAGKLFS